MSRINVRLLLLLTLAASLQAQPRYFSKVTAHYDRLLEVGTDQYGPIETALWLSSIDVHKGGQFEPAPATSRRTYRAIHAPHGSTLYWDQPLVALSYWLSVRTGEQRYKEAADAYLRDFLKTSVDPKEGYFLWGNHLYYDVFADEQVEILAPYHEMRPLPVAWEMLERVDAAATVRAARAAARGHLVQPSSGLFNRHAVAGGERSALQPPMPFLSAGGTLVETLAWLASRKPRDHADLIRQAKRVAAYSHGGRNTRTSLMPVQPVVDRWDRYAATTETGLWASSVLRAAELTGSSSLETRAWDSLRAYLTFGFSPDEGRYHGMLDVASGLPTWERTTEWQPGRWSDVWEPLFPSHDHPMPLAEACLTLYERRGDRGFRECAEDWATHIEKTLPAGFPTKDITDSDRTPGAYAESYGRVIHFLVRASKVLNDPELRALAQRIADDAIEKLWIEEVAMFRSHPGVDRIDSVDGLGILFAALVYFDTGEDPDLLGFHF